MAQDSGSKGVSIRSRAPVRISFAGGGTDVSPYCEERGGCVVNASINQYAYATLRPRKDKGVRLVSGDFGRAQEFAGWEEMAYDGELDLLKSVARHFRAEGVELTLRADAPPRSGLGSSAAAFLAAIGVFNHRRREDADTSYGLAELAYKLEREELGNHGGRQDQYASAFGGINFMEFKGEDFVRVSPLKLSKDTLLELEKSLVLANLGMRKRSGDIIADQTKNYVRHQSATVEALDRNKEIAKDIRRSLLRGDLDGFGELLHNAWEEKKRYSDLVSTPHIDSIYAAAREAGAIGGKLTGAGGGGHMLLFCRPDTEQRVAQELERLGARRVPFAFDFHGLQTWEAQR